MEILVFVFSCRHMSSMAKIKNRKKKICMQTFSYRV